MNKKVKWSVISVTSASLLTFAGLVASNTETGDNNNIVASNSSEWGQDHFSDIPDSNDSIDPNDSNGFGTDDGEQVFRGHGQREEQGQFSQDSENSQDQFFQAPSGGFEQGAGSSGSSH
jgi:hypothetical protein